MCDPAGPAVATVRDVLDLIGEAMFSAEVVAIPVDRLDERFFSLSSRFAGEVMQKFVNYRLRLAVIGDITHRLQTSASLRALVHESNTADQAWFVPDVEALDARLSAMSGRA